MPCRLSASERAFPRISLTTRLRDVYPPLTTVRLPLTRFGETAARLVLSGDAPQQPRVVPMPGEVVLRESTPPRPSARR